MSIRKAAKIIFTSVFALAFLPVASEFFIEIAAEQGVYDNPTGKLLSVLEFFTDSPIIWALLFMSAGGASVAWIYELLPKTESTCDEAFVILHNFKEQRPPRLVSLQNVAKYFVMDASYVVAGKDGNIKKEYFHTMVFLVFGPKLRKAGYLSVSSDDFKLPAYEIKSFDEIGAIIIFDGFLPMGDFKLHAVHIRHQTDK